MKYPDDYINKVICGDCLEVMREMPDKSVDLVLTDPPYGVRKDEDWDEFQNFLKNLDNWINECLRISKTLIWFCAGKMLPYILKDREDMFHRLLIWNKPRGSQFAGAMHSNIWYSLEPILVFGDYPKTDKSKRYGYSSFEYRTIPKKEFEHPTVKHIWLMKQLAYFYSQENDIILDPFLGSGTTAVACIETDRRFIGIEISQEYCDIANKRISQAYELKKQGELFD